MVHLMRADAFLGRAKQECGHQPLAERDMRALEQRSDRDRELLAAGIALIPAGARLKRRRFAERAAMAADLAIGPEVAFEPSAGGDVVTENAVVQLVRHGSAPNL